MIVLTLIHKADKSYQVNKSTYSSFFLTMFLYTLCT